MVVLLVQVELARISHHRSDPQIKETPRRHRRFVGLCVLRCFQIAIQLQKWSLCVFSRWLTGISPMPSQTHVTSYFAAFCRSCGVTSQVMQDFFNQQYQCLSFVRVLKSVLTRKHNSFLSLKLPCRSSALVQTLPHFKTVQ